MRNIKYNPHYRKQSGVLTRVGEENMLDRVEGWGPGPVESHHHEHEALGVEGSPAEEESKHDNH